MGQYGSQPGYVTFHSPGPLKLFLAERLSSSSRFRVMYQPLSGDLQEHFEAVTQMALTFGRLGPGLIYAIDEVDRFCDNGRLKVPKQKAGEPSRDPALKDLINYGRHRKVSAICTSRRPAQVARELTSQCAEIRCFRTTEPRDIRYFADIMGDTAANKLPSLGQYQYLRWTDDCSEPEIRGGKI